MALPILDGNQSATTLSTIVTGGAHIPAHTVVSLGTQAITDIATAVASSSVNISGGVYISDAQVALGENAPPEAVQIGGYNLADNKLYPIAVDNNGVQSISGTVTANVFGTNISDGSPVPLPIASGEDSFQAGGARLGVQLLQTDGQAVGDGSGILPISGTVTIGNSVTIGSALPSGANRIGVVTIGGGTVTIGAGTAQIGTVTASLQFTTTAGQTAQDGLTKILQQDLCPGLYQNDIQPYGVPIAFIDPSSQGSPTFRVVGNNGNSLPVTITTGYNRIGVVTIGNSVTVGSLPVQLSTTTIGGTARLNVTLSSATTIGSTVPSYGNLYGGSDGTSLRAISVDTSGRTVVTGSVSVASTTVTISAQPSGALTTRFGSVTTANTAQITTAVTNTSRKYLLAQNISAGTVTIGIGFSPTTTQGIQLTAGSGLTFDSFVPTGAVYWLGATTGAAYTILEG
jgi:hypothetical protein